LASEECAVAAANVTYIASASLDEVCMAEICDGGRMTRVIRYISGQRKEELKPTPFASFEEEKEKKEKF
jgi:hypothetical protein